MVAGKIKHNIIFLSGIHPNFSTMENKKTATWNTAAFFLKNRLMSLHTILQHQSPDHTRDVCPDQGIDRRPQMNYTQRITA